MNQEQIRNVLAKVGLQDLPRNAHEDLANYGMDSLMIVLSLAAIEKEFDIRIAANQFKEEAFQSIASIEAFLLKLGVA